MKLIDIARVAHEVNRAYCAAHNDLSQVPWEGAPEWQRDSAVKGVQFHLDNPGVGPQASHEAWLSEKRATGWKYGPVKDADKKEHPCFLDYGDLPVEQRAKDFIFTGVVSALRPHLELAKETKNVPVQGSPQSSKAALGDGEMGDGADAPDVQPDVKEG